MFRDLADFFADLDNLVSQPVRAAIVRRFCHMATQRLKEGADAESYRTWLTSGRSRFVRASKITDGLQAVPATLKLEPTPLSQFCTSWAEASCYRASGYDAWRPFTPEQNHVRVAMLRNLTALAKGNFTPDLTNAE